MCGNVPPWILPVLNVVLQIVEQKREWMERNVDSFGYLVQDYVKRNHYRCMPIFTDGSKDPGTGHVA